MIEFLKFLFSKDFISNAKDILALLKKSKEWEKDIVRFSGTFYHADRIRSTVLVDQSVKELKKKDWNEEEQTEVKFIMNELFDNSFRYGLPDKELSSVYANITITSSFIEISISDYGVGFDLINELQAQEAFNPESDKHKGLSLINKITPEFYQEKAPNRNTVILIKREGLRPLKTYMKEDVLVFEVGNSYYIDDSNFSQFLDKIKSLTGNQKIIIDFGSTKSMMITRIYRGIRENLMDLSTKSDVRITVCGLYSAPFVIQEYFEKHFPTFDTQEEALLYHQEPRKTPLEGLIAALESQKKN